MVRSLASRPGGHTRMSRAHADAKATEAAAPEATEAATAAARARRRTAIADARGRHGRLRQELAAGMTAHMRSLTLLPLAAPECTSTSLHQFACCPAHP